MKIYKLLLAALCILLACSLGACTGEVLEQGTQQQGSGQLGTLAPEVTTAGNAGSLNGDDVFANAEHLLTVRVLKTGKSDCVLIKVDDTIILMDTADADDYGLICNELQSLGISCIDYLILTHFDNDHIGTAAKVIEDFEVAEVYMPNYVRDSKLYRSLVAALDEQSARTHVTKLNDDTEIVLPAGKLWINVSRVYPDLSHEQPIPEDSMDNDLSLICGLSLGDFSALFMGDAEKKRCEDFLAQTQYQGQYDFVKMPHHGSYNKALKDVLTGCDVKYAAVCSDAFANVDNKTVLLLRDLGALTYYSYNGTFVLRTDGTLVDCRQ